jgi:hypothetical protein
VTTAGSATANSYVTLADAIQYHDDRPPAGTTWADALAAGGGTVNRALIWATKLLDQLVDWRGWRVDTTQALEWPRSGLLYPNSTSVPTTVIPVQLQEATAEFARQLLADDLGGEAGSEVQGLKKLKTGSLELEFKDSVARETVPDTVVTLLPADWYVLVRGRGIVVELLRA